MKPFWYVLLVVGVALIAADGPTAHGADKNDDAVAKELEKWQGAWIGQGDAAGWKIVYAGDKVTGYQG